MGIVSSWLSESFPPKSNFSVDDIPDLSGQVFIVTGGSSGLGKATTKELLLHNARVYIATRSRERAEEAIENLFDQTQKRATFLPLDLADLNSVKSAAEEFLSKETELHVLYNNGGVMATPIDQLTVQDYDMQWGVNVLGHFYFTKLLLPTLISTAKLSRDKHTRVVNISSFSHLFSGLDFDTFTDGPARRRRSPESYYAQSKHGNVVFTAEMARRYIGDGVVSTAINPGNIETDIIRHLNVFQSWVLKRIFYDLSYGVLTQLYAGTAAEGVELNGQYIIPWARVGKADARTQDPVVGKQLWTWLERQVEDFEQRLRSE